MGRLPSHAQQNVDSRRLSLLHLRLGAERAMLGLLSVRLSPMPSIHIERPHQLSKKKARDAVDEVAKKIAEKFQMQTSWEEDQLVFSRSGVKGKIAVNQSDVQVSAELGFMLGFLKGTIEQEINSYLDKVLV